MRESWRAIVQHIETDSWGNSTSGITGFYNDFYERLDILDTSGRFEAVLTRNVAGVSKLEAKGAILVRIVNFLISIEEDNDSTQYRLYQLGKSHSYKGIRPWQYAIFVQTLLLTISSRLGTEASHEIMEAWVNMLSFVLRSMLPPAIGHQVVETEINVKVSSAFATEKTQEELIVLEELKEMRRHLCKTGSSTVLTGEFLSNLTS